MVIGGSSPSPDARFERLGSFGKRAMYVLGRHFILRERVGVFFTGHADGVGAVLGFFLFLCLRKGDGHAAACASKYASLQFSLLVE